MSFKANKLWPVLNIKNTFWKEMLQAWCEFNYEPSKIHDQPIWYNSRLRIKNKPFFWKRNFKKGLYKISQLYEGGTIISIQKAYESFGLTALELNTLISTIPAELQQALKCNTLKYNSKFAECIDKTNLSSYIYQKLMDHKDDHISHKRKSKWENRLGLNWQTADYYKILNRIWKVTYIPKFRSFQYRLLRHAIVLNSHLYKWGMSDHDKCSQCCKVKEDDVHLFAECEITKRFWSNVWLFLESRFDISVDTNKISASNILFNTVHTNPGHLINFIVLMGKQYIYRQRCLNKPINVTEFRATCLKQCSIEKIIATKNGNLSKHCKKWSNTIARNEREMSVNEYVYEYLIQDTAPH